VLLPPEILEPLRGAADFGAHSLRAGFLTRPTTIAGVAALLGTWAEFANSDAAEGTFANDETKGLLGELAETLRAIG